MKRIRSARRWVLLAGFALVAGACANNTDATSEVASLDESGNGDQEKSALEIIVEQERQLFEFSACMRDEGVDIGDPTVDADGNVALGTPMGMITDHGGLMEAYRACRDLIGNRPLGHGGEDRSAVHDRLVDFAKCVRQKGFYDMPDPDFSDTNGHLFPGLDLDDPDYQAAEGKCKELLVDDGTAG